MSNIVCVCALLSYFFTLDYYSCLLQPLTLQHTPPDVHACSRALQEAENPTSSSGTRTFCTTPLSLFSHKCTNAFAHPHRCGKEETSTLKELNKRRHRGELLLLTGCFVYTNRAVKEKNRNLQSQYLSLIKDGERAWGSSELKASSGRGSPAFLERRVILGLNV